MYIVGRLSYVIQIWALLSQMHVNLYVFNTITPNLLLV